MDAGNAGAGPARGQVVGRTAGAGNHPGRRRCGAWPTAPIIRSWPMRGTLHLVAAEDIGWMLELTAARTVQSLTRRYRELGLDDATFEAAPRTSRSAFSRVAGPLPGLNCSSSSRSTASPRRVSGHRTSWADCARTARCASGRCWAIHQAVVLMDEWVPESPQNASGRKRWGSSFGGTSSVTAPRRFATSPGGQSYCCVTRASVWRLRGTSWRRSSLTGPATGWRRACRIGRPEAFISCRVLTSICWAIRIAAPSWPLNIGSPSFLATTGCSSRRSSPAAGWSGPGGASPHRRRSPSRRCRSNRSPR